MDKKIHSFNFVFNKGDNGGESLMLSTDFFDNGDDVTKECDGIYLNQTLTLQSYSNSASLNFYGTMLNPENLRALANKLEQEQNRAVGLKNNSCLKKQ
jgi:hypothetical protein